MTVQKRRGNPNFHIRLDPVRRAQWQSAADQEKRTLSEFIKLAADERAETKQESKQAELRVNNADKEAL